MQNQKGFTLITVIMLLVIALTLVVAISDRFIKTTHITLGTDSQARASAVAEAAIERILLKDITTLSGYITNNNCGADCTLSINLPDGSQANATVALSFLGNSTSAYSIDLSANGSGFEVGEINLKNYGANQDLSVCWTSLFSGSEAPSVFALYVSGEDDSLVADSYAYNSANSTNISNGFLTATSSNGYANCFTVDGNAVPRLLRLRALYNDVTVTIIPASGQLLPTQGIRLVSTGTYLQASKKVVVTKTEGSAPVDFEYVFLQKSAVDPLSN